MHNDVMENLSECFRKLITDGRLDDYYRDKRIKTLYERTGLDEKNLPVVTAALEKMILPIALKLGDPMQDPDKVLTPEQRALLLLFNRCVPKQAAQQSRAQRTFFDRALGEGLAIEKDETFTISADGILILEASPDKPKKNDFVVVASGVPVMISHKCSNNKGGAQDSEVKELLGTIHAWIAYVQNNPGDNRIFMAVFEGTTFDEKRVRALRSAVANAAMMGRILVMSTDDALRFLAGS